MRLAASRPGRQPIGRRWIAAAVSGLLQAAAFPPLSIPGMPFVALVPLLWAAFRPVAPGEAPMGFRPRFLLAFLAEMVFFVALLHWILLLPNEEITIPGLMLPALLFMAAYLSVFFGFAVAIPGALGDRTVWPAAAALPVFWTLFDQLRSAGALAFPWGSFGYALARTPSALQATGWVGYWFLPFWIVSVNALLYTALRTASEGRRPTALRIAVAAVACWAAPVLFGMAVLSSAPAPPTAVEAWSRVAEAPDKAAVPAVGVLPRVPSEGTFRLALVQSNTPREIKWKEGYRGIVVEDLLDRTRAAAALEPDLIVWPETAAPLTILWWPDLARAVRETVAELEAWVLVGTLDAVVFPDGLEEHYNAAVLFGPDGLPVMKYYKMHLVPFSEAMPLREEAPWLGALNFGQSDFSTGREQVIFEVEGHRFAVLICFESIFPGMARTAVARGARYLVNTTNDFWFGRSAGPVQHADMAILRAVENRTPLARCANTGLSFFVDPFGRVYGETGLFVEALPLANVPPGEGGSFYTRQGEWFLGALLVLAGLAMVSLVWASNRRRLR